MLTEETHAIKKSLIRRFQKGVMTEADLNIAYVETHECSHGTDPWGNQAYFIGKGDHPHYGRTWLYFSGENRSNLDAGSIHMVNCHRNRTIRCDVLHIRHDDNPIARELHLDHTGFYRYNPDRLHPDSILALKFIEITDPKPRSKGYAVVESFN